jgi:hypothetical protein
VLSHIDMREVRAHYDRRVTVHERLVKLFSAQRIEEYVKLALGIDDEYGNFSASERGLGDVVRAVNSDQSIFSLASELKVTARAIHIPDRIYDRRLPWLKISIGSEMAMMLKPSKFWVANVRTIWAGILIENGDDYEKANAILAIYRDPSAGDPAGSMTSEMDYRRWRDIHSRLEGHLRRLDTFGKEEAKRQGVTHGDLPYLWADAVANALYIHRSNRRS